MADEATSTSSALPLATETLTATAEPVTEPISKEAEATNGTISSGDVSLGKPEDATSAPAEDTKDKPATTQEGAEMKDEDIKADDAASAADGPVDASTDTPISGGKSKFRRKSTGVPEHKGKKLNKKASKAKMTHIDAVPGDYFYIRLKGYPLWPGIVCSEDMLPATLLKSRPVTAAAADGIYRDDYADGGPKAKDRTFPVMYLHTNEFSWIPNYDLVDLDLETVGDTEGQKMKKELRSAHELASEKHDLEYFKGILKDFAEAREALAAEKEAAKEAAKAAKAEKKAAGKKKEKSAKTVVEDDENEDAEMPDVPVEADSEEPATEEKKIKKRKLPAEDTPQRTESAKKPRIKINNTPKAPNGAATPKSAKESTTKSAKPKIKKTPKAAETPEATIPKEPELTPEEKRIKKEKEILFLRHKLQKGLLTKEQEPKEEEMKQMAEFVTKLEGYADLEVSIIRTTKINKVLKAILKIPIIPKEEEFKFKPRSQTLLDKWNKLLASDTPAPASATTNGVSTEAKAEAEESKASPTTATNGTKESSADVKVEAKLEEKAEKPTDETASATELVLEAKEDTGKAETTLVDGLTKESIQEPTPV